MENNWTIKQLNFISNFGRDNTGHIGRSLSNSIKKSRANARTFASGQRNFVRGINNSEAVYPIIIFEARKRAIVLPSNEIGN